MSEINMGDWANVAEKCDSTVDGGEYICCLPVGHADLHLSRKYRNPHYPIWADWGDEDADEDGTACAHVATDGLGDDLWRCDRCGVVLREVRDEDGDFHVTGADGESYLARWEHVG